VEAGGSELAVGTVIGPYRIEALLGEGGMGKVFRAVRQGATEPVALKVMRSRLSGEEEPRRRFLREARSRARCATSTWCRCSTRARTASGARPYGAVVGLR
jgi:serine/threonine protein kinase